MSIENDNWSATEADEAGALRLVEIAAAISDRRGVAKGALAEPFYVPSGSMEPTLLIGDALLASKYPYGYSAASLPVKVALPATGRVFGALPDRGDVVVFRWPGDRHRSGSSGSSASQATAFRCARAICSSMATKVVLRPDGVGAGRR